VAPWTIWWRRNFFAGEFEWVRVVMATSEAQMVVIVTGVVTALAGLAEARALFTRRRIPPG
jgi:hypothetical protein